MSEDTDSTYNAGDYIPANATVTVTFDATIDSSTVSPGETAYNSFGYLYSASTSDEELSASPRKVGVQVPTAPTLVKKLVESDGKTVAEAEEEAKFTFLIYAGDTTVTGDSESDLLAALYKAGIYSYTTKTVTVEAGESVSESELLSDLKTYMITQSGDSYIGATDGSAWSWTDGNEYTIIEIPNTDYDFVSWNTTTTTNKYTFTYDSSKDITLTCVNKEQSWTLTLYKVDAAVSTKKLSGAVFALYSKTDNKVSYTGVDSSITVDDVTWYLYEVQTTGDDGTASWSDLTKDEEYYLVEVEAPDGYNLTWPSQTVSQKNGETNVTVTATNEAGYELPNSGGTGTRRFLFLGLFLCSLAALALYGKRRWLL